VERRNVPVGLPVALQEDCYLPTDAGVFYLSGVPILSAFTGPHSDYHTPRDTPDKLNYEGAARTARLMALITRSVAAADSAPDYVAQAAPNKGAGRAHLRAYLGTIPDYAATDAKGVLLSGVSRNGPADKAGLKAGDMIVELAGRKIDNIYDYTYAIEAVKIGQPTKAVIRRGDKRIELEITPGSRD
jgi:C-terminal processing protease CtpA/Prc